MAALADQPRRVNVARQPVFTFESVHIYLHAKRRQCELHQLVNWLLFTGVYTDMKHTVRGKWVDKATKREFLLT